MKIRLLKYGLLILLLCLGACDQPSDRKSAPVAEKGVLDLSDWDFRRDGPISLSGEFEFFWKRLLNPQDLKPSLDPAIIGVPRTWNNFEYKGEALPGEGFATYHLKVLVKKDSPDLALALVEASTAYRLFVNGQPISSAGIVGRDTASSKPGYNSEIDELSLHAGELDIVMHVSNFSHRLGGAWESIELGPKSRLQSNKEFNIATDLFLFGSIFIMALYHLGIFSLRRKERSTFYFGLFCLLIALRILVTGDRHILMFFPGIDYQVMIKLEYLTFYLAVPVFIQYFHSLFADRFGKVFYRLSIITGYGFAILVVLTPVKFFSHTLLTYQLFTLSMFLYATALLVIAAFKRDPKAIIFLIGYSILFGTSINDMLYAHNIIQSVYAVQLGLFVFIFSQAYLISRYFSEAFDTIEIQAEKLNRSKLSLEAAKDRLERRVEARTAKIFERNRILNQEVEDRKQAQAAMKEAMRAAEIANQSKSEFLANMSHELRTPLNHIIGFTELVLYKNFGELNQTQEDYLSDVHSSSGHLLSLINDILDLSKIEAGKIVCKSGEVNLREALTNSLRMIKEKAMKRDIRSSIQFDGAPESIHADERKIKQILYNLLSNAVKFAPDGGQIDILAKAVPGGDTGMPLQDDASTRWVQISVADNGIGLKEQDRERIFKPFEQVEHSTSRKYPGTGLGLALTKSLVELHGGRIWADSEGEGQGAIFSFCIPSQCAAGQTP